MKVAVACPCGGSFAAPPHLAGQTVPCPNCAQPIVVPAATDRVPLAPAQHKPSKSNTPWVLYSVLATSALMAVICAAYIVTVMNNSIGNTDAVTTVHDSPVEPTPDVAEPTTPEPDVIANPINVNAPATLPPDEPDATTSPDTPQTDQRDPSPESDPVSSSSTSKKPLLQYNWEQHPELAYEFDFTLQGAGGPWECGGSLVMRNGTSVDPTSRDPLTSRQSYVVSTAVSMKEGRKTYQEGRQLIVDSTGHRYV